MRRPDVCAAAELPPGTARVVREGPPAIGVHNLAGTLPAVLPVATFPLRLDAGRVVVELDP